MMKRKCPFGKIKCEECVLYRKGFRYYDDKKEPTPFEECAINIGVDSLENLVTRSIGNQKATEETRNEINNLTKFLVGMAQLKALEKKEGK
jgi:hypothetical protein